MMTDQSIENISVKDEPLVDSGVTDSSFPIKTMKVEPIEEDTVSSTGLQWENISVKPEPEAARGSEVNDCREDVPEKIQPVVLCEEIDKQGADISINQERVPRRVNIMGSKAFAKRGAVYKCRKCMYSGDKQQMTRHFVRYHVPRITAPFACSNCNVVGHSLTEITKHIEEKHQALKIEDCLQGSGESYILKEEDATMLSKQQSIGLYGQRSRVTGKGPGGRRKPKKWMPLKMWTGLATGKSAKQLAHLDTQSSPSVTKKRKTQSNHPEVSNPASSAIATSQSSTSQSPCASFAGSVVSKTVPAGLPSNPSVPLSVITDIVKRTVHNTMGAMASAIISASRPPEQDLRPITNQIMATNENLAQIANILEETNNTYDQVSVGLQDVTKSISGLTSEISEVSRAISTFTDVAQKIGQHMVEQTVTMQSLVQGTLDAQENLAETLRHQTDVFNSMLSHVNGDTCSESLNFDEPITMTTSNATNTDNAPSESTPPTPLQTVSSPQTLQEDSTKGKLRETKEGK